MAYKQLTDTQRAGIYYYLKSSFALIKIANLIGVTDNPSRGKSLSK